MVDVLNIISIPLINGPVMRIITVVNIGPILGAASRAIRTFVIVPTNVIPNSRAVIVIITISSKPEKYICLIKAFCTAGE